MVRRLVYGMGNNSLHEDRMVQTIARSVSKILFKKVQIFLKPLEHGCDQSLGLKCASDGKLLKLLAIYKPSCTFWLFFLNYESVHCFLFCFLITVYQ